MGVAGACEVEVPAVALERIDWSNYTETVHSQSMNENRYEKE